LFYANAARFTDHVKGVVEGAPTPVRWLVLDCSSITDVDYSAGLEIADLITYLHQRGTQFGLAHADATLLETLRTDGVLALVPPDRIFSHVGEVFEAWEARPPDGTDVVAPDLA
jgi:MFS superfamily sulfate permease-like transporter